MGEPVRYASVATNTPSQNATAPSCGTDPLGQPERMSRAGWLQPTGFPSASTGRCHEDVRPPVTLTDTGVWGAERPITALRLALECRRSEPLTPYRIRAWEEELSCHGLQNKYPALIQGFRVGFNLGIPRISCTYTPPNHNSIRLLTDVYMSIVTNEFTAGRYIGPFTRAQLEADLGPFQTSPLSVIGAKNLKTQKISCST